MPNVLRIIARLNLGGPARHVMRIDGPLARRGWRTLLVTGSCEPDEPDLIEEARDRGVDVRVVPELGRALRPGRDAAALWALRRIVRETEPDVVHTHTAKAGLLGRLAALKSPSKPLVVHTYHGHVLRHNFGPLTSAWMTAAERRLARASHRLIAVADQVAAELRDDFGVGKAEQWAVIPPGIDPLRTAADPEAGRSLRHELGLGEDHVLIGVVGRLEPVKQIDRALDAFAALPQGSPGRLLVMGDGSLGQGVRRRVAALPGAHWLPSQAHLGALWGALDLLLLPSRCEGLPQAVVEALRAGVPVVASDVGGLAELVQQGQDGLLVDSRDAPALAAALSELVGDRARRRAYSAHAQSRDWSAHDPERVGAALARLYGVALTERALETGGLSGHAAPSCGY
ncbi:MAG: glycosyltransferase involved in cell wall biosynthesis [Pseudohongiellaceae bacterium]|jgi:glycosyltransferase involved in cell wall biosynthesis